MMRGAFMSQGARMDNNNWTHGIWPSGMRSNWLDLQATAHRPNTGQEAERKPGTAEAGSFGELAMEHWSSPLWRRGALHGCGYVGPDLAGSSEAEEVTSTRHTSGTVFRGVCRCRYKLARHFRDMLVVGEERWKSSR